VGACPLYLELIAARAGAASDATRRAHRRRGVGRERR
jgi:hypothetical protein